METRAGRTFRYSAARAFAVLGRKDDAFRLLDRAADEPADELVLVVRDPWLASLHSDPRHAVLLKRMGLQGVTPPL